MINGYVGANGPENGFQQGSVDLWLYDGPTDETRGLSFGISNAIFEQHTFQRGRIARMINASFTTGLLGIGLDAGTGAVVVDEASLSAVTGETAAVVVDLHTYAASGEFAGPTRSLALRGAVTHLIPPGDFGYDLAPAPARGWAAPAARPGYLRRRASMPCTCRRVTARCFWRAIWRAIRLAQPPSVLWS